MSALNLERIVHRYHNDHELCAEIMKLSAENKRYREALEFYAQDPIAENGTVWSESCLEWRVQSFTWEPLTDLGKRAREALNRESTKPD